MRKLMALAETLGLRVALVTHGTLSEPLWTGVEIICWPSADSLAHEIAHWLVADEERRDWPNYGLGGNNHSAGLGIQPRRIRSPFHSFEEENASLLGILIQRALKTKLPSWKKTLQDHCWEVGSNRGRKSFMKCVKRLRKMGVIRNRWTPSCMAFTKEEHD